MKYHGVQCLAIPDAIFAVGRPVCVKCIFSCLRCGETIRYNVFMEYLIMNFAAIHIPTFYGMPLRISLSAMRLPREASNKETGGLVQ